MLGATTSACSNAEFDRLADNYIERWAAYYPSAAFSQGSKPAAFQFEAFSPDSIQRWLDVNTQAASQIASLKGKLSAQEQIDARVLLRQTRLEQERWQQDQVVLRQPQWYAGLISQALTYALVRDGLTPDDKFEAIANRLIGISSLCQYAIQTLVSGDEYRTRGAISTLSRTAAFFSSDLAKLTFDASRPKRNDRMSELAANAARDITALADHLRNNILKAKPQSAVLGREAYARKLRIYADYDIAPEQLAAIALVEINTVRNLMATQTKALSTRTQGVEQTTEAALSSALLAMEKNRVSNREDFLKLFSSLTFRAEQFLIENNLATVPQPTTLYVALSPDHFAGAAVGGVYPAGTFAPEFNTLFYLPSIPDDSPSEQISDFYRSFNNHFNTMIVAHEMFPGHYLQYKVATQNASKLRTLFADDIYVEGWGSFSEVLMLDAGWGGHQPMDRLAHLRKRLENATRAYSSVMVHTQGWDQEQLTLFATTQGLVPRQFAINLWNRVMNSPLQLITYFLGFHGFSELWEAEQLRQGTQFKTREFVDTVLRAGPIPIDALNHAFGR